MEKKMYFCSCFKRHKMMNAISNKGSLVRLVATDAAMLALACLIPAASHLLAVPLYRLNPMLALLLAGMLLGKDWRNGLLLAVLLPSVSCLVTGMPAAPKMATTFHSPSPFRRLTGLQR